MRGRSLMTLALVGTLLLAPLTGCLGSEDEANIEWANYEEAKSADGPVFAPNETSPIRVKWLQPNTPDNVPEGQSSLFLLVYNNETDEPVTDAEISLDSRMPAMGHGTAAEQDPVHQAYGVYEGIINPSMGGDWVLNLQVTLSDDTTLGFQINYTAAGDGMDHDPVNRSATLNASVTNGTAPLRVTFEANATGFSPGSMPMNGSGQNASATTNESSDQGNQTGNQTQDNETATWILDFGDGNQTNGTSEDLPATVEHTYNATGNLSASFVVTYSDGETRDAVVNLTILEGNQTDAGADYQPRHKEWVDAAIFGVPYTANPGAATEEFVRQSLDNGANGTYVVAYDVNVTTGTESFTATATAGDPTGQGAIDYDMYVFLPDDALAGSSTNPGTNEEVSIPVDTAGTYTVAMLMWAGADAPPAAQNPFTLTVDAV